MSLAIILGGATGDLIVAAGFFIVKSLLGDVLAPPQVFKHPLVLGAILTLSGIVLLFIVNRSTLFGLPEKERPRSQS